MSYYHIFIYMITDYFIYKLEIYNDGDVSIRYYLRNDPPYSLSYGVVRLNVQYGVGELNQTVVIIRSMEIDRMLEHLTVAHGMGEQELINFVNDLRDHCNFLFTYVDESGDE